MLVGILLFLSVFLTCPLVSSSTVNWMIALWAGVSLPLHALGSYYGFQKAPSLSFPVKTLDIPRPILRGTSGSVLFRPWPLAFVGGVLPLTALWLVVRCLRPEFWIRHVYTTLTFATLAGLIFVITVVEVSILTVYIQLCNEVDK